MAQPEDDESLVFSTSQTGEENVASPALVEEISRQLQGAGLTVVAPHGPYLGWTMRVLADGQTDPRTGITVYGEQCLIGYSESQWIFRVWNSVPGPDPESLEHLVATPEEIVTITLQFFMGEPLTIEGWQVPKHRHPEWNEHQLRLAIAHAQPLSPIAWAQVRQRAQVRYNRLFLENHLNSPNPRTAFWNEWYSCLFVPIRRFLTPSEKPSHEETLWIRRDLLEVYLVQEQ